MKYKLMLVIKCESQRECDYTIESFDITLSEALSKARSLLKQECLLSFRLYDECGKEVVNCMMGR